MNRADEYGIEDHQSISNKQFVKNESGHENTDTSTKAKSATSDQLDSRGDVSCSNAVGNIMTPSNMTIPGVLPRLSSINDQPICTSSQALILNETRQQQHQAQALKEQLFSAPNHYLPLTTHLSPHERNANNGVNTRSQSQQTHATPFHSQSHVSLPAPSIIPDHSRTSGHQQQHPQRPLSFEQHQHQHHLLPTSQPLLTNQSQFLSPVGSSNDTQGAQHLHFPRESRAQQVNVASTRSGNGT